MSFNLILIFVLTLNRFKPLLMLNIYHKYFLLFNLLIDSNYINNLTIDKINFKSQHSS